MGVLLILNFPGELGVSIKKEINVNLNMSINDNFSSYIDEKTGVAIFVDSFDNKEFEVRIGSTSDSVSMGAITASSDEELNRKVLELFEKYQGEK